MFGALLLFEDEFIHVVSISFTGLILTELIMVALTIRTWHWLMVIAEFISLAIYILSLIILKDIFGKFFFLYFNQPSDKGPSINDVSSEWEGGGVKNRRFYLVKRRVRGREGVIKSEK